MFESKSIFFKLVIAIFCFVYGILFMHTCPKNSAGRYCGIGEFSLGFWSIFDEIQSFLNNVESILLIQTAIYICAEIAVCSFIAFTIKMFITSPAKTKNLRYIFIFPAITFFLNCILEIFSTYHLFLITPEKLLLTPYPGYNFPKTTYYYFHSAICYIGIVSAALLPLIFTLKRKNSNKTVSITYLLAAVYFFITNFYKFIIENFFTNLYLIFPEYINTTSFFIFSTVTFFIVYFHKSEYAMRLVTENLYDSMEFPIIIFSDKDTYIDANQSANNFFKKYGVNPSEKSTFTTIFPEDKFSTLGTISSENSFYLSGIQDKNLFYCKKSDLYSFTKKKIGYYLLFTKIDIYSEHLKHLDHAAHSDELTGCKKRTAFDHFYLNQNHSLKEPLIVICARINRLEQLNENLGLKKTDFYVVNFANILKNSIIKHNIQSNIEKNVFRISGSLFAFIISAKNQDEVEDLFRTIRRECSAFSKNRVEPLTCSLGYSASSNKELSSTKMLQKSFDNMLLDSHNSKADKEKPSAILPGIQL